MALPDISLRDLEVFSLLARVRSVREVARRRQISPSQISKWVRRLEHSVGKKLFERSLSGVTLTTEGMKFFEIAKAVLRGAEPMERALTGEGPYGSQVLSIGSTTVLTNYLLSPLAGRFSQRMRLLDFAPDQLVAAGLRGAFELAVTMGPMEWTRAWAVEFLGKMTWQLYAGSGHSISSRAREKDAKTHPFVVPAYWGAEGFSIGTDHCPLRADERIHGHETSTAEAALLLLGDNKHLAFLPKLLADPYVASGKIRSVRISDWPEVELELYLAARADTVPQLLFRDLRRELMVKLRH